MDNAKKKAIEDNIYFSIIYNKYKMLALNSFTWENLPNGIESRHIENALYGYGMAFFYEDDTKGLMCLPCSSCQGFNAYGDPQHVLTTEFQQSGKRMSVDIGVLINNNMLRIPTDTYIWNYSYRMFRVEDAINTNINQQRFPYFITTDEKKLFSFKNLFKNIENGEPVIYGKGSISVNDIQVFNTNTPYVVDKLTDYRTNLENQILTFLGLNNTTGKKERMLVDEVNVNNDFINSNIELMYRQRLEACRLINEKFGTDIKVYKTVNIIDSEDNQINEDNENEEKEKDNQFLEENKSENNSNEELEEKEKSLIKKVGEIIGKIFGYSKGNGPN